MAAFIGLGQLSEITTVMYGVVSHVIPVSLLLCCSMFSGWKWPSVILGLQRKMPSLGEGIL